MIRSDSIRPDEAKAIAETAYVFAYPMMESYKTMYNQTINKQSNTYRAPFNQLHSLRELATSDFTDVVSPNNDTLYTMGWLDLRTEPVVLSVPAVPDNRYYSFQFIDAFTFDWAYVSERTTGSNGGTYLIRGPDQKEQTHEGFDEVFTSISQFVLTIGRTAVKDVQDQPIVHALQDQYALLPLSTFMGEAAPPRASRIDFPAWDDKRETSADFIGYLNFLLSTVELYPKAQPLIDESAKIGVGAGRHFNAADLEPDILEAVDAGVKEGHKRIETNSRQLSNPVNGWNLMTDVFGTREMMEDKDLTRASAAMIGLFGNISQEAYYPMSSVDSNGQQLDGSRHDYVLHFTEDQLPPVNAFWSFSLYKLPEKQFTANPIDRYSIGDRTEGLEYGDDGSLTIYVSDKSPGKEREANWLPAPNGQFYLVGRLYLPKAEAIDASPYAPPAVRAMEKNSISKAA